MLRPSSRALVVAAVPIMIVTALLWMRPAEFPDRLANIHEESSNINNKIYFDSSVVTEWWGLIPEKPDARGMGLLHLLNPARVPYFERHWRRILGKGDQTGDSMKDKVFLDVGCGGGIATEALAQLGFNMTGVDVSEPSLEAARQHAALMGVKNVKYMKASAYDLPFENETFDGVVSSDVLEHIHNLRRMVSEIARVLKPGGVFVFDTINRSWQSWFVSILGAQEIFRFLPSNTHDWRLFITPEELTALLAEFGLEADTSAYRGMRPSLNPFGIVNGLLPGLLGDFVETWDLSNNYLGYAVKKK